MDNQSYAVAPHRYECLVAAGAEQVIEGNDVVMIDGFLQQGRWIFGHLSYSLASTLHGVASAKQDRIGFAPLRFFVPRVVLEIKQSEVTVHAPKPQTVFEEILEQNAGTELPLQVSAQPVLSREEYIAKIDALQRHILRGDCYEVNFCQEFFAEEAAFHPLAAYQKLATVSPNPFSAFYRANDSYLLCASPERFLSKQGNRIFSQPIKGTIRRDTSNATHDEQLRTELAGSAKDQSENVMVVDLVRNDLTQICEPASVQVDELYGIYSYPQVHQMISTVSGRLKSDVLFSEIIRATFPMGSMTGAPKRQVMELIERYEPSVRGLFSGAVGYIAPNGDFDFNVVIRSILYNAAAQYLSYQVGSGITFYSDAAKEWEECLLKAEAIRQVLGDKSGSQ